MARGHLISQEYNSGNIVCAPRSALGTWVGAAADELKKVSGTKSFLAHILQMFQRFYIIESRLEEEELKNFPPIYLLLLGLLFCCCLMCVILL